MADARIVRVSEGDRHGKDSPWLFKHSSLAGGRFDFMVGTIPYLSGPPLHVHDEQDDTFLVLDGVFTVQVRDELLDLQPGDFATIPPGVPHTFDNIYRDQRVVRVVNLMTPGGLDRFFDEQSRLAGRMPEDLLKKHGLAVVGPTIGVKLGRR